MTANVSSKPNPTQSAWVLAMNGGAVEPFIPDPDFTNYGMKALRDWDEDGSDYLMTEDDMCRRVIRRNL